jgi:hypothetical protein
MSHVEHIAFCVKFKDCVTARYKHNIRTLTRNIKFIGTRLETERKPYQRVDFLPVSTAPTYRFYVCRQCTYIVYFCDNVLYSCTQINEHVLGTYRFTPVINVL